MNSFEKNRKNLLKIGRIIQKFISKVYSNVLRNSSKTRGVHSKN